MSFDALLPQKISLSVFRDLDDYEKELLSHRQNTLENCKYLTPLGIPEQEPTLKQSNKFTLLHHNVRSIVKNGDRFQQFLYNSALQLSCILVTETWLTDSSPMPTIPHFSFNGANRVGRSGGGVGIFINNMLSFRPRHDIMDPYRSFEFIIVETCAVSSKNVIVCCVYRPPDSNVVVFLQEIEQLLAKLLNERKLIFIGGDFNFDLIQYESDNQVSQFINAFLSYNLYPTISRPTRVGQASNSLLDCFFTNFLDPAVSAVIAEVSLSDHYPILLATDLTDAEKNYSPPVTYHRIFSEEKTILFNERLTHIFTDFQEIETPSAAVNFFCDAIKSNIDTFFPIKRLNRKTTPLKPWISHAILVSINVKNALYKAFLQRRTLESHAVFKTYKNRLINIIRASKKNYYQQRISSYNGDSKKTWQTLKEIMSCQKSKTCVIQSLKVENQILSNQTDISNGLNDFFTSVGSNIERNMSPSEIDPASYIQNEFVDTCFMYPVTPYTISDILKSLKASEGGVDPISSKLLKLLMPSVTGPLCHIVNLCFSAGFFPDSLKVSTVTPIFKSGDKNCPGNYRPISVLSSLSKIIEKCIYMRIADFLTFNNILGENQYGFRNKHSTEHALLNFVDLVSGELEKGNHVIGVFLDIKKAFDSVNFSILFKKMSKYGIRGKALDLIKSYLSNRKQRVKLTDKKGNCVLPNLKNVSCGVRQGSLLGPLLFLIYVNDLQHASNASKIITFADDTNLFMSHPSLEALGIMANQELEKLKRWFLSNRLCLNISKTSFQIYSKKRLYFEPDIKIHNVSIKREKLVKFLGVLVDESLTFRDHINHVCKKISTGIGLMARGKEILETKQLKFIYNALVLPHLSYCSLVWGINYNSYTIRLLRLQKRAARLILGLGHNESVLHLFSDIGITPFKDLLNIKCMVMIYKIKNNKVPFQMLHLINWRNHDIEHHGLQNNELLEIPFSRTAYKQRTFRIYASTLCNALSARNRLDFDVPISTFKNQVKELLRFHD